MKKIRINELARELEVKAHEILDRLPELGVQEKKTHSSSIDEDVAIKLRRLYGFPVSEDEGAGATNGDGSPRTMAQPYEGPDEAEPAASGPAVPAVTPEPPTGPAPVAAEATPERAPERPAESHAPPALPIRPPLAGKPIQPPIGVGLRPESRAPGAPAHPAPAPPAVQRPAPQTPSTQPPAAVIAPGRPAPPTAKPIPGAT